MVKAIAYIRVSTEDQHLGPEAQEVAFDRWLAANDVEDAGRFSDLGLSGGKSIDDRPGLLSAVTALRARGATVLWVYDRTRLARDVYVALTVTQLVQAEGARVLTASDSLAWTPAVDNPDFILRRGVEDLFAEHERAKTRFRTKAALAVLKASGRVYGRVPFGLRRACGHAAHPEGQERTADCGRLIPDTAERETFDRIDMLRGKGLGHTAIATRLNAEGRPSARGGRWYASSVRSVLKTAAAAA